MKRETVLAWLLPLSLSGNVISRSFNCSRLWQFGVKKSVKFVVRSKNVSSSILNSDCLNAIYAGNDRNDSIIIDWFRKWFRCTFVVKNNAEKSWRARNAWSYYFEIRVINYRKAAVVFPGTETAILAIRFTRMYAWIYPLCHFYRVEISLTVSLRGVQKSCFCIVFLFPLLLYPAARMMHLKRGCWNISLDYRFTEK